MGEPGRIVLPVLLVGPEAQRQHHFRALAALLSGRHRKKILGSLQVTEQVTEVTGEVRVAAKIFFFSKHASCPSGKAFRRVTTSPANTTTTITSVSNSKPNQGTEVTVDFTVSNGPTSASTGKVTVSDGDGDSCTVEDSSVQNPNY